MPLANCFLRSPAEFASEPFYPLEVYLCEGCSLVQLLDVISAEVLFREYIYVSGTSDTIAAHNKEYAGTVFDLLQLGANDFVVEVASNDGSLLKCFRSLGVRTLGIEPARNIAEKARANGIETMAEFFRASLAQTIRASYGPARVVIGNNVLAHVDETSDFLHGCRSLLADDGLVVLEVPYLMELIKRLEYDTIYHEHLCYFSVHTLMRLCETAGLSIVRVDRPAVHGGSLRIYAGPRERHGGHREEVAALAAEEQQAGLLAFSRYQGFAAEVENNRREILGLLASLTQSGKTIAAYGAPAKGNTLLNYCGIDTRLIPYTVDKNSMKVGFYTPGMHIPVLPVSTLLERQPDYVMILAWNFAQEIMNQQAEYRARGGRFIIPIPRPAVV